MKYFNQIYYEKLAKAIAEIESVSQAEVVVIAKPLSESYLDCCLLVADALSFVTFTYFMFSPTLFGDSALYFAPLLAFCLGFIFTSRFNFLHRAIISNKRKERSVEIMARALFQKAGINRTTKETGILIYVSLLEKKVFLLPDRGIANSLSIEEWKKLNDSFKSIFLEKNMAESLINKLNMCKEIFAKSLPIGENDINELPNNLEVSI